jgi:predicted ATPase
VVDALARCDETGDHWYAAELRRIHGELLFMGQADLPQSGSAIRDAEACLLAALELSLVQGCRSLQLRAATTLGGLWHLQGRSADAAHLLQSACASVTEGLDWDDYQAAAHLLRLTASDSAAGAAGSTVCPPPASDRTADALDVAPPRRIKARN